MVTICLLFAAGALAACRPSPIDEPPAQAGRTAGTGRYEVTGDHIDYWDTGFTADGRFDGDVLHHGGYLFYREGSQAHRNAASAGRT